MLKKINLTRVFFLFSVIVVIGCKEIKSKSYDVSMPEPEVNIQAFKLDDMRDMTLGNPNAQVHLIIYSSLTCHHCASLHQTIFHKLKENYIDKGLINYTMRELPFNRQDYEACILARCAPKDKYYTFINILFAQQDNWIFKKDYKEILTKIGQLGGVKAEEFASCLKDKNLENIILQNLKDANALKIEGTPTLFINGKLYKSAYSYEALAKELDAELKLCNKS